VEAWEGRPGRRINEETWEEREWERGYEPGTGCEER